MKLVTLSILAFIAGCSGSPVLDSPAPESLTPQSKKVPDVLEPVDEKSDELNMAPSAGYESVMNLLAGLGYQGIGMEHEDSETLDFVKQVFTSPQTHEREIERVYTGLKLSYDAEQKSLTLGEERSVDKTLQFIQINIPARR